MDVEDIEIQLFVRAMQLRHGYDFSEYAPASLKRRVLQLVVTHGAGTISELNRRLLHDEGFVAGVIEGLSVPVSEMFRDPPVFRPILATSSRAHYLSRYLPCLIT